jgi:hypothetical protein
MADGTIKSAIQLVAGDALLGEDGTARTVLEVTHGVADMLCVKRMHSKKPSGTGATTPWEDEQFICGSSFRLAVMMTRKYTENEEQRGYIRYLSAQRTYSVRWNELVFDDTLGFTRPARKTMNFACNPASFVNTDNPKRNAEAAARQCARQLVRDGCFGVHVSFQQSQKKYKIRVKRWPQGYQKPPLSYRYAVEQQRSRPATGTVQRRQYITLELAHSAAVEFSRTLPACKIWNTTVRDYMAFKQTHRTHQSMCHLYHSNAQNFPVPGALDLDSLIEGSYQEAIANGLPTISDRISQEDLGWLIGAWLGDGVKAGPMFVSVHGRGTIHHALARIAPKMGLVAIEMPPNPLCPDCVTVILSTVDGKYKVGGVPVNEATAIAESNSDMEVGTEDDTHSQLSEDSDETTISKAMEDRDVDESIKTEFIVKDSVMADLESLEDRMSQLSLKDDQFEKLYTESLYTQQPSEYHSASRPPKTILHNVNRRNVFTIILKKLGLLNTKLVTEELKWQLTNQSKSFRLAVLAGLIDTDGYKFKQNLWTRIYCFSQADDRNSTHALNHPTISRLSRYIAQSLGFKVTSYIGPNGQGIYGQDLRIIRQNICGDDVYQIPCEIPYKRYEATKPANAQKVIYRKFKFEINCMDQQACLNIKLDGQGQDENQTGVVLENFIICA